MGVRRSGEDTRRRQLTVDRVSTRQRLFNRHTVDEDGPIFVDLKTQRRRTNPSTRGSRNHFPRR
ncbi:hypothetical protein N9L68_09190 [bacterium]|nr:hypothetical protein [bacterium]